MSARDKVIISHIYPPIPTRDHDWCAYYDGEEEEGNYGWGATPEEALADLDRIDQERAEALEDAERMDSDYAEQQGDTDVERAYASDALAIVALALFVSSIFMLCMVLT